ncbi:MAG: HD domain-containing protein [Candidatus ainarchaeum sp.]|nr:HD domain-containing protein [Candidatus ainarchaeum sp.]MDD3976148.1 HD domain-containing protein [Candidatus ainarchaeum sp.]
MIPTEKQAIEILKKYIKGKANLEHNLIVGYGMKGISKFLGKKEDEQNRFFVIGTLHDIDLEKYNGNIKNHCVVGEEILNKENIDKEIIRTIKTHNEILGIKKEKEEDHLLFSIDGLSGIIRAYVLMRPDRDITQAKLKSIKKKLKDKGFAANVSREEIYYAPDLLKIERDKFIEAVLEEVKNNMDFRE